MRVLGSLLIAGFLILVGAHPAVGEATVGLALHGAEVLLALVPGAVWLAGAALAAMQDPTSIDPDGFRPLPIVDERTTAARATAEALLAGEPHARRGRQQGAAGNPPTPTPKPNATAEGRSLNARTRQAPTPRPGTSANRPGSRAAKRQKRDDNLDTWAARAIIAGTVGLTASGEIPLARMVGFDKTVAWLLPFVIDVYVIQAFRRHRDIVQAITLTVAANVTYHLADARLFGLTPSAKPTWWLIAMVASVASLILWRVHLMTAPPKAAQKRRQNERQQTPVPSPTPPPVQPATTANLAANNDRQEATTGDAKKRQNEPAKIGRSCRQEAHASGPPEHRQGRRQEARQQAPLHGRLGHPRGPRLPRRVRTSAPQPDRHRVRHRHKRRRPRQVSDSTAKNIRAEILDRAELPSLEDTE